MKRNHLHLATTQKAIGAVALLLAAALLLSLAACGGKDTEPINARETEAYADLTTMAEITAAPDDDAEPTTPADEEGSTADIDAATEAAAVPTTPAEVLAAYTEAMNKAKKEAKHMRKLDYQILNKDKMNFELDVINTPGVLDWLNDNLMTTKEKGMQQEVYTLGTSDMYGQLPVTNTPLGCMVKDSGAFSGATARQLPNGNIELTLVMKPEDNPEPAAHGATTSPSRTGGMFNPLSKAGVDELIHRARFFITTKLEFSLRYHDCKSVLVYDPVTMQVVTLRQDYNVLINVANGRVLFINAKGNGTLEAATVCDQFRY